MAFSGTVYWINTGGEFIGKWDSRTGVVTWASIYNLPNLPNGDPFDWGMGLVGPLVALPDGRIISALGSQTSAAALVIEATLAESAATYWTTSPETYRAAGPDDVEAIYDPVAQRVWISGLRNYDDVSTGDADTWTGWTAAGAPSFTARMRGAWDFIGTAAFDQAYPGGGTALHGRTLYRNNSNGWIDRYDLDSGAWDVSLMWGADPGPNQGRLTAITGCLNDGTPVYQTKATYLSDLELWTIDQTSLYLPIDSPNTAFANIPGISDQTPTRAWALDEPGYKFAGGSFGDNQGIQIIDDVAYYFRQIDGRSYPNEAIQFVAHDLTTDTREVVFTLDGVFLNQDGSIGDPEGDYWDNVYYPSFGLVVIPQPINLNIAGQLDATRVRFL